MSPLHEEPERQIFLWCVLGIPELFQFPSLSSAQKDWVAHVDVCVCVCKKVYFLM